MATQPAGAAVAPLLASAQARFQASCDIPGGFFEAEVETISQACLAMARRFYRGGRLWVFGLGSSATDAHHVSVEFVHPVIVGKRALPAIALNSDSATTLGLGRDLGQKELFAQQLKILGRAGDIALGLMTSPADPATLAGLAYARQQGLLTLLIAGAEAAAERPPDDLGDFCFTVVAADWLVIQETQETLYHILWELVHLFFDHKGLLE